MNSSFWNSLYFTQYQMLPWTKEQWSLVGIEKLDPFLSTCHSILDYGCGNGNIASYFIQKGHDVDLADISSIVIDIAKRTIRNKNIKTYIVTQPSEIITEKKYDAVLAWGVFHHIDPANWNVFLSCFSDLMKPSGLLIIGGWSRNDIEFMESPKRISFFTKSRTWAVNGIKETTAAELFTLKKEEEFSFIEPISNKERKFIYYVFKK